MKKLALALMCLVSVAFFASCKKTVEHPEPSISFLVAENFISSDATLQTGDVAYFSVKAVANSQTNKLLKTISFMIIDDDTETRLYDTIDQDLNAGSVVFDYGYHFKKAGNYSVVANIIDADGKTNEARLKITVETKLVETAFSWVRTGANVTETTAAQLASVGLQWTGSAKDIFATIKPLEGTKLYVRPGNDYANLLSVNQMAAYYSSFSETTLPSESYRNISATQSADYNDMLFTLTTDGNYHAVLIQHAAIENLGAQGTQITITGNRK